MHLPLNFALKVKKKSLLIKTKIKYNKIKYHNNNNNNKIYANTAWYTVRWEKGRVLKGNGFKLCWDFDHRMRKTSSERRLDLTLEDEKAGKIWLVDM